MTFEGQSIQCSELENGIVELRFDLQGDSVNKFNRATLDELGEVVALLDADKDVRGLLVTSGKDGFIVGADVTEFTDYFSYAEDQLVDWLLDVHRVFSTIEDFDFPTVTAINGVALGGGLEVALTTSYRVMATTAKVGLPETKLGIFPGFGGTVRLSRLTGADNAIEWIAGGSQYDAETALKTGVVDAVIAPEKLREGALRSARAGHGGPEGLEGAPAGEDLAAQAEHGREHDGVRDREGFRRWQGGPELPVARRGDQGDSAVGDDGSR